MTRRGSITFRDDRPGRTARRGLVRRGMMVWQKIWRDVPNWSIWPDHGVRSRSRPCAWLCWPRVSGNQRVRRLPVAQLSLSGQCPTLVLHESANPRLTIGRGELVLSSSVGADLIAPTRMVAACGGGKGVAGGRPGRGVPDQLTAQIAAGNQSSGDRSPSPTASSAAAAESRSAPPPEGLG